MLNSGADLIHLDVMDGTQVPNISFGFPVIDAVAKIAEIPMDTHLMIVHPEHYFERVAKTGSKMCSFHLEAADKQGDDPAEFLKQIKGLGMQAGFAINPDYDLEKAFKYLEYADFILVMTVFAGFGGQKIIPYAEERIAAVAAEIKRRGLSTVIEIDGGVSVANAPALGKAGAQIMVAGSQVFKSEDPLETIRQIQKA